jgi:hypothetical protein
VKLTEENVDYMDCRPLGEVKGEMMSEAFKERLAKAVAAARAGQAAGEAVPEVDEKPPVDDHPGEWQTDSPKLGHGTISEG